MPKALPDWCDRNASPSRARNSERARNQRLLAAATEMPSVSATSDIGSCSASRSLKTVRSSVLAIHYQSEDHILRAGNRVYVDASERHSYCGQSENRVAKAIIISTPPRM
jgi:hypothetical protein